MKKWKKRKIFEFLIGLIVLATVFFGLGKYNQTLKSEMTLEKQNGVKPKEPIMLKFSLSMMPENILENLTLDPPEKVRIAWNSSKKSLKIIPENYWKPETGYRLNIKDLRNIFLLPVEGEFHFQTISYPKVAGFYPALGEKDVIVDIEDPIKVGFEESIRDYNIKFSVDPPIALDYEIDPSAKEIKLLSKNGFEKGMRYDIAVGIQHKDEDSENYKEIYKTYFETLALPPTDWEKDFNLRLVQAKKFTQPKITQGKYIDLNVKSQVMVIFEEGKALDAYLISTGKRGMDTKQGNFKIHNKFPRAFSKAYGLYMPFWMAVVPDGKFGIHELPEWPGGYKEGANHLGIPVSHGCIRLGVGPAERVYNWAEIGTPVVIHD